ncbi:class I SAM-dependent methyltransferase [Candidatus Pacearchaeota archaeon]|nr:class I SAM-dependent methyltransferase [Candidatus Pacearchaeota archaeon]
MKKISVSEFNKWEDQIKKSDLFLDIGCWNGGKVLNLSKRCHAFGIDIDKQKLSLANPRIKNKLRHADATIKIPFDKKFDWIYLSEVIEHVKNDDALLKNISSSLKIGGKLILTTPKSVGFFQIWDPAWVRWKFRGPVHRHYTLNKIRDKLLKHHINIEFYAIGGSFPWVLSRWVTVFFKYLLKSKKQFNWGKLDGFCNIKIIARRTK